MFNFEKNKLENYNVEVFEARGPDGEPAIHEVWRNDEGQIHRLGDLPAITIRDPASQSIIELRYLIDGKMHRTGGPADIRYIRGQSTPDYEAFYSAGKPSRTDGPAVIYYDLDGSISRTLYLQDGEQIPEEDDPNTGPY